MIIVLAVIIVFLSALSWVQIFRLQETEKKIIAIDSDKCNHCGKCITLCIHEAREYVDDIDSFYKDLQNGEKISLIVEQFQD